MTGSRNQIRAILLVAVMVLSGVAIGAAGLSGVAAADDDDDASDTPEYTLEFNDAGEVYAFGSPMPLSDDQTITGLFDDPDDVHGSIYVFDDGSWEPVGDDSVENDANALEAYILSLEEGDAEATIQLDDDPEFGETAELGLAEGFNFITPTQQAGVNDDDDAFRTTQDALTVQNPFAQPSVSAGDEDDFAGSTIDAGSNDVVNPFAGYFVSATGGLALSDVNTDMTQEEVDEALGVEALDDAVFDVTIDEDERCRGDTG